MGANNKLFINISTNIIKKYNYNYYPHSDPMGTHKWTNIYSIFRYKLSLQGSLYTMVSRSTRHGIISFIDKVFKKHLGTWMKSTYPNATRSTPLPSDPTFQKKFNTSTGSTQNCKENATQLSIRRGRTYLDDDYMPS